MGLVRLKPATHEGIGGFCNLLTPKAFFVKRIHFLSHAECAIRVSAQKGVFLKLEQS